MKIKQVIALALALVMMATVFVPVVSAADSDEGIDLSATVLEPKPEVGITVDTDHINFGELLPGETSDSHDVVATNVGLKPIEVTMNVEDDGSESIFSTGIAVNGDPCGDYCARLNCDDSDSFGVALHVPDSITTRGAISGSMIVFAQAINTPVAEFSADVVSGSASLTVRFTDQSSNSPTAWSWDFGDDGTSTEQNPTHIYTGAGIYTVSLTVTNLMGSDTEVKSDYITVIVPPTADFSATPLSGDVPLTVQFTDLSTNSPTSWSWSFGDGAMSSDHNPSHMYEGVGVYTVSLIATNSAGSDTMTKTAYITVNAVVVTPSAEFSADVVSGVAPLTVHFTDLSTNTPTSWAWDFDNDGNVDSYDQNPSYIYETPGTYAVKLTASNSAGSDDDVKDAYIVVSSPVLPPAAAFTADVVSGNAPLAVHFTDQSTNSPTAWSWDFGDGNTSSEQSLEHIYTAAGTYTVSLTATNAGGSDTMIRTEYITVDQQASPASDFTYTSSGGAITITGYTGSAGNVVIPWRIDGLPVTTIAIAAFKNKALTSVAIPDSVTSMSTQAFYHCSALTSVSLPDGITVIGDYTFYYCIALTSLTIPSSVTNIGVCAFQTCAAMTAMVFSGNAPTVGSKWAQGCASLVVYYHEGATGFTTPTWNGVPCYPLAVPAAAFLADATSGMAPLTVHFTDQSTNSPTSWAWDFNSDGTVDSTAQNPSHTYETVGTFTVKLTATSVGGSDDEVKTDYITVTAPPVPVTDFTANVTLGTMPLAVHFTDQSSNLPTSWSWSFGDGGISTAQNPNHVYAAAGTYTVSLTATNAGGSDTMIRTAYITVNNPLAPTASFIANIMSGMAPLTVHFTDQSSNTPTSWSWSFGDDSTSVEQNPGHEYAAAGTYTVSLTATNAGGSDTVTKTAYITAVTLAAPVADFSASPVSGGASLTVHFTDLSMNHPTSWSWDFDNDGVPDSNEQNPTYTYDSPDIYSVTLTATNAGGSDTVTKTNLINVEWSLFHGNQQLTGYYAGDMPDPTTLTQLWKSVDVSAGGQYGDGSVTVGGGMAFVYCFNTTDGSTDISKAHSWITAINITTGQVVWYRQCQQTDKYGSWATPVYADGFVFTPGDGCRYASDGSMKWGGLPAGVNGGPMVADGKVIQADWSNGIYYCYDEFTGQQLWSFNTHGGDAQGVAAYHDGKVFLTSYATMFCVNADNGQQIWSVAAGSPQNFCGSPMVANGFVYVTTYNFDGKGTLACYYESNGTQMWKVSVARTDATPAIWNGMIFIDGGATGYAPNQIAAYNATTGAQVWHYDNAGSWPISCVVADGYVYTAGLVLNATDGTYVTALSGISGTVAIYNGMVLGTGSGGYMYCYGAAA